MLQENLYNNTDDVFRTSGLFGEIFPVQFYIVRDRDRYNLLTSFPLNI